MEDSRPKKVKQNISDEERERRRQRMLELRKKLAEAKEENKQEKVTLTKKTKKKSVEKKRPEPVKEESESEVSSDSDVSDDEPYVPPVKPIKRKPKADTKHLKKKISVKYYGKVSKEEVDNDNRLLEQLHNNDNELKQKKKIIKSNVKQKTTEPTEPTETTEPVKQEESKVDRAMRELFGG